MTTLELVAAMDALRQHPDVELEAKVRAYLTDPAPPETDGIRALKAWIRKNEA